MCIDIKKIKATLIDKQQSSYCIDSLSILKINRKGQDKRDSLLTSHVAFTMKPQYFRLSCCTVRGEKQKPHKQQRTEYSTSRKKRKSG